MRNKIIASLFIFTLIFAFNVKANTDSTIVAGFSYEIFEDLGKPSVIQFYDQSTGNPTQYSWDFGDGSISNVKNPVHYFPENGNYQVRLIVANNSSSDQIAKDIEINVPLNIDFTFKLDSNNVVPNTFIFSSTIDGYYDQLVWNFGDQILQDIEDTIHSYTEEDKDYQVTLTTRYFFNDTSVMTKALAKGLTTSEYFNLGGQVFLDDSLMNNPVSQSDTGIAYLFRVDDDQLVPIDTNTFQKLGYYWFDKKLKAHYLVQVSLKETSTHANDFAPTYVGNTTYWDEAEIINLAQNKYREDVSMVFKDKNTIGEKSLSGNVKDLIEVDEEKEVLICLFDTENNLVDYQYNASGSNYEFNNLQKGHYLIGADIPGIYSRSQLIFVDDNKTNKFKSLNILSEIKAFPNPAQEYTLISLQNENGPHTEIQIFNSSGHLLRSERIRLNAGTNYFHLDLKDLPPGVLYIKIIGLETNMIKLVHY